MQLCTKLLENFNVFFLISEATKVKIRNKKLNKQATTVNVNNPAVERGIRRWDVKMSERTQIRRRVAGYKRNQQVVTCNM